MDGRWTAAAGSVVGGENGQAGWTSGSLKFPSIIRGKGGILLAVAQIPMALWVIPPLWSKIEVVAAKFGADPNQSAYQSLLSLLFGGSLMKTRWRK